MKRFPLLTALAAVVSLGIVAACIGSDGDESTRGTADAGTPDGGRLGDPPADAPVDTDADAAEPTFCDGNPKPVGIDDYLCADFDRGSINAGFTSTFFTSGGTLEPTSVVAASAPNALLANMSASDTAIQQRGGALEWLVTGTKQIKTVSITVKINPNVDGTVFAPSPGSIELVGIEIPSVANISLRYQDGAATNGDLPSNYKGYYLHNQLYAGAVGHLPISPAFASAQWTTMKLDLNFSTNKGTLSQNGSVVLNNVSVATQPTSNFTFDVGYRRRSGTVARPTAHRFDDVIVAVTRQ
jgi:hypothetical protein